MKVTFLMSFPQSPFQLRQSAPRRFVVRILRGSAPITDVRPTTLVSRLTKLAMLGLLLANAPAAEAVDIVNLQNATQRPAGEIVSISKTEVTIKPLTGENIKIPANDIVQIEYGDASGDFKLAMSDEAGGRFDSALDRLNKVKAANPANPHVLAEVNYALGRIQARLALVDAEKQTAAIEQLTAAQKAFPDFYRFYEAANFLGQVYLAKQDYAAARTSFDQLSQSPFPDYQLAGKIASAKIQMGEGQNEAAIRGFQEVIDAAGTKPGEQARKFEAMLGLARGLIASNQLEEALKSLDEVTRNGPANNAPLQAEAYTLQGNCLEQLGRTKEAVLAFLHVDVLFPSETVYHAESLYHLSRLWKNVQLPERALDAQTKLEVTYPNSPWTKRLAGS